MDRRRFGINGAAMSQDIKRMIIHIFIPISLAIIGEIVLKHTLNGIEIVMNAAGIFQLMLNPWVIISLTTIILAGILWVTGMSYFSISFMYPFMPLSYVGIVTVSVLFLGETISLRRMIALGFVMIGMLFISRSPNKTS